MTWKVELGVGRWNLEGLVWFAVGEAHFEKTDCAVLCHLLPFPPHWFGDQEDIQAQRS